MIQCLRSIALELITFFALLEDFQKKLWLKKKFVVSSHYCITLDRVPEALWPEVVANAQQWARWKQLGVWDGDAPGTMEDLKAAPYRMVDKSLFEGPLVHQSGRAWWRERGCQYVLIVGVGGSLKKKKNRS